MIEKHLYRRTIEKKGKKISCWYFWFWLDGKQVRRSCGQNGKPCLTKRDAMAYISTLTDEDLLGINNKKFLQDWCMGMYDVNSEYLMRQKNKGFEIVEKTRNNKSKYLEHILEKFGKKEPDKITPSDIDSWLLSLDLSNGTRNAIITVFNEVFKELDPFDYSAFRPDFRHCSLGDDHDDYYYLQLLQVFALQAVREWWQSRLF